MEDDGFGVTDKACPYIQVHRSWCQRRAELEDWRRPVRPYSHLIRVVQVRLVVWGLVMSGSACVQVGARACVHVVCVCVSCI